MKQYVSFSKKNEFSHIKLCDLMTSCKKIQKKRGLNVTQSLENSESR